MPIVGLCGLEVFALLLKDLVMAIDRIDELV